MQRSHSLIALACLASLSVAPDALAGGRNPGSVLIYPVHRSGPTMFSIVSVTNTNLNPATPVSLGGSTNVHYEYVNVTPGSTPFMPLNCVIFDRIEFLTPADTLSVLTTCHNAVAGNIEGYVVVTAEDPAAVYGTAWSFDYLVGSEIVISASGVGYSINAIPFSSPVASMQPTDLDGDDKLDFDGNEYEGIADYLIVDSFVAAASSQLTLINLTGGDQDKNTVLMSIWNDNEFPLSTTLAFNCWFDQPLSRISPLFSNAFLATVPNDPRELDLNCDGTGDIETGWAIIDSIDVSEPGGGTIATDGAVLGAITTGPFTALSGGRLLWESENVQTNGAFFNR
ncbi:MAG: hypothetical protein AAF628_36585 [Planctomycetota bacterium]